MKTFRLPLLAAVAMLRSRVPSRSAAPARCRSAATPPCRAKAWCRTFASSAIATAIAGTPTAAIARCVAAMRRAITNGPAYYAEPRYPPGYYGGPRVGVGVGPFGFGIY